MPWRLPFLVFFSSLLSMSWIGQRRSLEDLDRSTVQVQFDFKAKYLNGARKSDPSIETTIEQGMLGTGVVLSVDPRLGKSLIVTARHVVNIPDEIHIIDDSGHVNLGVIVERNVTVRTWEGVACSGQVIFSDPNTDLAFVQVDCLAGRPSEPFHDSVAIGTRLVVVGTPRGYHPDRVFVIMDGIALGIDAEGRLATSAPVAPGNSGSGVWVDGGLAGIIVAYFEKYDHVSLAVPWSAVEFDLEQVGTSWDR